MSGILLQSGDQGNNVVCHFLCICHGTCMYLHAWGTLCMQFWMDLGCLWDAVYVFLQSICISRGFFLAFRCRRVARVKTHMWNLPCIFAWYLNVWGTFCMHFSWYSYVCGTLCTISVRYSNIWKGIAGTSLRRGCQGKSNTYNFLYICIWYLHVFPNGIFENPCKY